MSSMSKALSHFDRFYPYVYSAPLWRSIRLGLLCKSKKMFLINNAYNDKTKLIGQLQMNGAIDFIKYLSIKENTKIFGNEFAYLQDNQMALGTQMDEFVKTTKYIGERSFYTKTISNSYTAYSSSVNNEEQVQYLNEDLHNIKLNMLNYEVFDTLSNLKIFAYPRGVCKKDFPVPYDEFQQAGFYPIDGFSVLVVLLMNIKMGDKILDMCAAPGGKSVTMLQTGYPSEIVCIDNEKSRITRLRNVLKTHTFPQDLKKVSIIQGDSVNETKFMDCYFDKVLVDAPCSTDRHAVSDKSFSLFQLKNDAKRRNLFSSQYNLLRMAVKSCRMGGDIFYSTCTLSPVQNDKTVVSVIKEMNSKKTDFQLRVVNCRGSYNNSRNRSGNEEGNHSDWFSTFNTPDTIGETILPNIMNNYGPGYICKIRKIPK